MSGRITIREPSQPHFLMCRPQYFAVTYSINPWMDPRAWANSGEVLHATAARQWAGLHRTLLARGAAIEAIEPEPGLPDLVFTANAAVVLNRMLHHLDEVEDQRVHVALLRVGVAPQFTAIDAKHRVATRVRRCIPMLDECIF
jgi:hypothetical protein